MTYSNDDEKYRDDKRQIMGLNFIKKPYFSHNFEHVEYSNENFDMTCKVKDLHTVRNKVEYKPPKIVLPPKICKEFLEKNLEFWRVNDSHHKKDFRYQ